MLLTITLYCKPKEKIKYLIFVCLQCGTKLTDLTTKHRTNSRLFRIDRVGGVY